MNRVLFTLACAVSVGITALCAYATYWAAKGATHDPTHPACQMFSGHCDSAYLMVTIASVPGVIGGLALLAITLWTVVDGKPH